ncbi:MAG: hypothetical protein ACTSYB_09370 [Candidatus Helarchaeota archaeon]
MDLPKSEVKFAHEFNVKEYVHIEIVKDCYVEGIINLYWQLYQIYQADLYFQTCYPYLEMLDQEWINCIAINRDPSKLNGLTMKPPSLNIYKILKLNKYASVPKLGNNSDNYKVYTSLNSRNVYNLWANLNREPGWSPLIEDAILFIKEMLDLARASYHESGSN